MQEFPSSLLWDVCELRSELKGARGKARSEVLEPKTKKSSPLPQFHSCLLSRLLSFPLLAVVPPPAGTHAQRTHTHAHALAPHPNRKCPSSAGQPSRPPARSAPAAAMIPPSPRSGPRGSATPRGGCSTRAPLLPGPSGSGRAGRRRGEFGKGKREDEED